MSNRTFRVGIVGLQPGQNWAGVAHLPAIEALKEKFQAVAVVNSRYESSLAAAKAFWNLHNQPSGTWSWEFVLS